jgi:hypothetical protein
MNPGQRFGNSGHGCFLYRSWKKKETFTAGSRSLVPHAAVACVKVSKPHAVHTNANNMLRNWSESATGIESVLLILILSIVKVHSNIWRQVYEKRKKWSENFGLWHYLYTVKGEQAYKLLGSVCGEKRYLHFDRLMYPSINQLVKVLLMLVSQTHHSCSPLTMIKQNIPGRFTGCVRTDLLHSKWIFAITISLHTNYVSSNILWKIRQYVPDNTVQHPRRQSSEYWFVTVM